MIIMAGCTLCYFGFAAAGGMSGALFLVVAPLSLVAMGLMSSIPAANRNKPLHPKNQAALVEGLERLNRGGLANMRELVGPSFPGRQKALVDLQQAPLLGDAALAPWLADLAVSETTTDNVRLVLKALSLVGGAAVPAMEGLKTRLPQSLHPAVDAFLAEAAAAAKLQRDSVQAAAELAAAPVALDEEAALRARVAKELAALDSHSGYDAKLRARTIRERLQEWEAASAVDARALALQNLTRTLDSDRR